MEEEERMIKDEGLILALADEEVLSLVRRILDEDFGDTRWLVVYLYWRYTECFGLEFSLEGTAERVGLSKKMVEGWVRRFERARSVND